MATVTVTRDGKPVSGALVEAISTFGFSKYYQEVRTDANGRAIFKDNANRFHLDVNGRRIETVGSLYGEIEVNI